jgi:2-polyprenyl-6-methoxyphenol hydroxylase-like FAD-dependent oxidoreductase
MTRAQTPHRIVIVGGGAGGLELATRLGDTLGKRGRAEVTLIDKSRTHVWKPKLHEIASGSMDLSAHEVDYLAQAHWHHFRYRIGEMTGWTGSAARCAWRPIATTKAARSRPTVCSATTRWCWRWAA